MSLDDPVPNTNYVSLSTALYDLLSTALYDLLSTALCHTQSIAV